MNEKTVQPYPPIVIGIAGGTGSGKTTVALKVQEAAPGRTVQIVHHDSYYRDNAHLSLDDRAAINYDHPNAFETELLISHLEQLRAGHAVDVPIYDYAIHARTGKTRRVEPADIVFIEGILVLESETLRNLMDIRLYVGVDPDERFIRRLRRDIRERGRSIESVIQQYRSVVKPMHEQFVNPTKKYAHLIIPQGGHNTVAIDMIVAKIHTIIRERKAEQG